MANKKSSKKKKKFILFKSIGRGIYYLLSKLYSVIDKLIVIPNNKQNI